MPANLLSNGDFEADWSEESSHRCLVCSSDSTPIFQDIGNIFTPPGWVSWFFHEPGTFDQPEVRDSRVAQRIRSGSKSVLLFTFNRRHCGGFYQRVAIAPERYVTVFLCSSTLWPFKNSDAYWDDALMARDGSYLTLTAYAHAWSNHDVPGYEHYGDAGCSVGVGCGPVYIPEGDAPELNGDPLNDAIGNFLFLIGIDPYGGEDPFATRIEWGDGAHIYNGYHGEPLSLEVRVPGLVGAPREPYERTYVLLPPTAGEEWADAVVRATWDNRRYTLGGSADDAGIGDLDVRRVVAVNPGEWVGEMTLEDFFDIYYPGVEYEPVYAADPDTLAYKLEVM
jgi:hypothetical protein